LEGLLNGFKDSCGTPFIFGLLNGFLETSSVQGILLVKNFVDQDTLIISPSL
jgi:hypothetical protein